MDNIYIWVEKSLEKLPQAAEIRKAVFIEEQGFENEFDDIDKTAWHALLSENGVPAATGRLFEENGTAHIGRICVVKTCRGKGYGDKIVTSLEKTAKENGYTRCALSAQTRVKPFYEKLGYHSEGEEYMDEFCPHILMVKTL